MNLSVPAAARSKALVCGRSFDGILGSNKFDFVTKCNFVINFSLVSTPVSNGVILQPIGLRKGTIHANHPMQFCVWLFLDLLGVCWMVRTHTQFCKDGARPVLFQISYLCCYVVICVVLCIVCVEMCTVLLLPGVNPVAVDKYIISSILPETWMSVSCTRNVSGRGLCVELITPL
jgi:hypothetical protein